MLALLVFSTTNPVYMGQDAKLAAAGENFPFNKRFTTSLGKRVMEVVWTFPFYEVSWGQCTRWIDTHGHDGPNGKVISGFKDGYFFGYLTVELRGGYIVLIEKLTMNSITVK